VEVLAGEGGQKLGSGAVRGRGLTRGRKKGKMGQRKLAGGGLFKGCLSSYKGAFSGRGGSRI